MWTNRVIRYDKFYSIQSDISLVMMTFSIISLKNTKTINEFLLRLLGAASPDDKRRCVSRRKYVSVINVLIFLSLFFQ